jgi:hypothetical protein
MQHAPALLAQCRSQPRHAQHAPCPSAGPLRESAGEGEGGTMSMLNWGMINDGGAFESLMHAILDAEDPEIILFGRPGPDQGQDARSGDGKTVYQAKYRSGLNMDGAIKLALEELQAIQECRQPDHQNYIHWKHAKQWILVANFRQNPNDIQRWENRVIPEFQKEQLAASYWCIETLEGKLVEHPEVRDVFFGGENRVLVGLKSAQKLITDACSNENWDKNPVVGRESAMQRINEFAKDEKHRILPIDGPMGIGKTRILYESLVQLGNKGWRVLWGLSGEMAESSKWFTLLNGNKPTCVAIDDPDDPRLVRRIIEQLGAIERDNWRFLIAYRSEKSAAISRYIKHPQVCDPLELKKLGEENSHNLLVRCSGLQVDKAWCHRVYRLTDGNPGWLCLLASLAKKCKLHELPDHAGQIACTYIEDCLSALSEDEKNKSRILLYWLALWGVLSLSPDSNEQPEAVFLEKEGLPRNELRELLAKLVNVRLIYNWGVQKRLFAVRPVILQQELLSWNISQNVNGTIHVSEKGNNLVTRLLAGSVPSLDAVLSTVAQFSRIRLPDSEAFQLLKPIFKDMQDIAEKGTVIQQKRIVELVEKCGYADPESALDVLVAVRINRKDPEEIESPIWGKYTITHEQVSEKLPETLRQIAEHAKDAPVPRRILEEYAEQVKEPSKADIFSRYYSSSANVILKRLLCESDNYRVFSKPAVDIINEHIEDEAKCLFVGILLESLLNPLREHTEWVGKWTLSWYHRPFTPDDEDWNVAQELRKNIFIRLSSSGTSGMIRVKLWKIISESHHAFNRTIAHCKTNEDWITKYKTILKENLKKCAEILQARCNTLSIEEATAAKCLWEWHVRHDKDKEISVLANQCEQLIQNVSRWRVQDFFRFAKDEELVPETERVAHQFVHAADQPVFKSFFAEATRYLKAARGDTEDLADGGRISQLALACAQEFKWDGHNAGNALSEFVVSCVSEADEKSMGWRFATRILLFQILDAKKLPGEEALNSCLKRVLQTTSHKGQLLYELYSNVHPRSTGILTDVEFKYVCEYIRDYSAIEKMVLLGSFYAVNENRVRKLVCQQLESAKNDLFKMSDEYRCFIRSFYYAALRYGYTIMPGAVKWIIESIAEFKLEGDLLGGYELDWLRDQAGFKMSVNQFAELIKSRMHLEQHDRPDSNYTIMPYEYPVTAWCHFDEDTPGDIEALHECCRLSLEPNFTAYNWMPLYLSKLDPSGEHVGSFAEDYLNKKGTVSAKELGRLGYLASNYPDDADAWKHIAVHILKASSKFSRDERHRIYFGLSKKERSLSGSPGVVFDYYVERNELTKRFLESEASDSPFKPYWEWAFREAADDLERDKGRTEEDEF